MFLSFMFLFCLFLVLFYFILHKKEIKIKIKKIQKQCVFVYIGTCVPCMAIETKFLNFVSLVT